MSTAETSSIDHKTVREWERRRKLIGNSLPPTIVVHHKPKMNFNIVLYNAQNTK